MCEPHSVAIIGGGISGLCAAVRLLELGISPVVFEAQPHAGGRIASVTASNGVVLDLGATWFHGTEGNAAFDIAVSANLQQYPTKEHVDSLDENLEIGQLVFATSPIVVAEDSSVRREPSGSVMQVVRAYDRALHHCSDAEDPSVSLLSVLKKKTDWASLSPLQRAAFRSRDLLECSISACHPSTVTLSSARLEDYEELPGDNVPPGKDGMGALVKALLSKIEPGLVHFNSEVIRVDWQVQHPNTARKVARIVLANGEVTFAKAVIWTPSLNVTKKCIAEDVFHPPLPMWKIQALDERTLGVVEKVHVILRKPLVDVISNATIPVLWLDEQALIHIEEERRIEKGTHWKYFVGSVQYKADKDFVSFWICGDAAVQLLSLSESTRKEQISDFLQLLFQQPVSIAQVIMSEWSSNRFTLGSYSYNNVHCKTDVAEILSRPLPNANNPVLHFAGEGMHHRFYSTMHGAAESGYREAQRVFEKEGNLSGRSYYARFRYQP